ncbi:hypothetical protein F2Q68_00040826 [Brassica cretica]|uniref:Cation-transporting P-type ATPase N-terminal domain-containing protein n=1 Tax=Brassica cretica TaxID=69181 RepID=A0A8S9MJI0_BRACR|nr:hypothetical protein F2Q68_00040826 [Brassica cretica]
MAGDLDKPLLDPDTFNREGVDLGLLPLEEVFEHLRTTPRGLLSEEAEERLKIFGLNRLEEKQENKFLKFLGFMWNPLSWVMEAAALIAIALANSESQGPDWEDFVGIVCLLLINATISFFEENNAGNAAAALMAQHKYEIVKILQEKKHVVGMTGDGVNDAPALKKADIGIAVADATDAARSSADIVLTEPGLSVIISAVLTSRAIFQRMKNYTLGFTLLALIWEYDFPPFMVLIIAILNDGTIMTISKDRVRPSPTPESWKLNQIFATGIVIGTYLALVTVLFYWLIVSTTFFEKHFHVKSIAKNTEQVSSAVYLQVSIISQALIFVTRSRSWSFLERPGTLLIFAFLVAQLAATLIAVYAKINFANITGIGWGWAGVIWLYSLIFYVPLDVIKFVFNYALSGDAWNLVLDRKTAFTYKKDDGTANVTITQRSHSAEELSGSRSRPSWIAEQTRRRAEIARLVEGHSVSRHLESVIKLKQIDSKMIRAAHTV